MYQLQCRFGQNDLDEHQYQKRRCCSGKIFAKSQEVHKKSKLERWIAHAGDEDVLLKWPPYSHDFTLCDYFHLGYVKGLVYVPPLPINIEELKLRIKLGYFTEEELDTLQKITKNRKGMDCY